MRRLGLLFAGILAGSIAVSGGDEADLDREIDRLRALLKERIARRTPPAEETPVLVVYGVADLRATYSHRPEPPGNVVPSKYQPPERDPIPEPSSFFEIDSLIEMIRVMVEPESWEMEGTDIQPKNGSLFVRTIPRVHVEIERFLAMCRSWADRRVGVEVAFVPLHEGEASLISSSPRELGDEVARRLLSRERLGTLALAGFDGQILGTRAGREIAYVRDYSVEIAKGSRIGDPVVHRVLDGCTAEVLVCLDDGKGAILDCQLELSRVSMPPPQPTEHGDVELPVKRLTRVQTSFWAPLGRTVVAGGCTEGDTPCIVLVTVWRR